MWDTWYLEHEGRAHMFHLQRLGPGSDRDPGEQDCLGHAVSDDLIHWTERPLALCPGPAGALDDMQPWTGCAVQQDGKFYLYYTMRSSRENGRSQRIGLAISDDLDHWERHKDNPVIEPDDRWYVSYSHPMPRAKVDCRDLTVVKAPEQGGWLGFYAACIPAEEEPESAAIAAVRSYDLVHWEHLPPAFHTGRHGEVEVPDVFFLDGRWYMICLTSTGHGNRGGFSDPNVTRGTIYAVAERPEGPYREIEGDNVLMGGDSTSGVSCRSLFFQGKRYVFYHQGGSPTGATLSPPMLAHTIDGGRLRLAWSERQKLWRKATLVESGIRPPIAGLPISHATGGINAGRWQLKDNGAYFGVSRTGWQVADLGVGAEDMEIEARVTLQSGVAGGLTFRPDSSQGWSAGDVAILLDAQDQCVHATRLSQFDGQSRRAFPVRHGRTYHVRVCIRQPRYEVFVDDILILQAAITSSNITAPSMGLFVDRGCVEITDLAAYALEM